MVSKDEFRKCLSKFVTGVTVVTTLDDEDNVHGMSANSFASVCLDPPLVLVCVAHETHTHRYVENRGYFGVNVLSRGQEDLGRYFARRPEDRHGDVRYDYSITDICKIPALEGALAFFGCQVVGAHEHGDHTVYIAEVKEMHQGESASPLVFYESHWYRNLDWTG